MDKTDRLRDYGLAFLLYEQGLGLCGYELIRELFIFVKLILNSYLYIPFYIWYFFEWAILTIKYKNGLEAYFNIRFEKEAYAHQDDMEYLKKRRHYSYR